MCRPVFVTDAAINIAPDLDGKRDIIQNVVDLYNLAGFGTTPRVAILSAVETVTSKIPSTIEAAALCKMADCLYREENDQAIAERMARAVGEKQEIVDMISRKGLGLFSRHCTQLFASRF
jgi:polysaccharide pyruvyl transferase WcaK-like protein